MRRALLCFGAMARINENYRKLQAGYLFPEIGRRVAAFTERRREALASVEKRLADCVRGEPERPDARHHRARALFLLGREDEALAEAKQALRYDSGFVPARHLRLTIFEKRGDIEDRIKPALLAGNASRLYKLELPDRGE